LCWDQNKLSPMFRDVSPRVLRLYSQSDCQQDTEKIENFKAVLSPFLATRMPSTPGSKVAREYIIQFLENLGWSIELDEFTQDTIIGEKTFVNIIATYHPDSPRRLVLAAHYDTKITPEGFIGAIDSAVPCAMILNLATRLNGLMQSFKGTPELTLQLIFFDGEEAFKTWTDTDSLYGSRHLASLWNSTSYTVKPNLGFCQRKDRTELDRIDSFVLLDLIGAKNPKFWHFSELEGSLYDSMRFSEDKMRLTRPGCKLDRVMGSESRTNPLEKSIQDDHIPFLKLGIRRILHLIAAPFPAVWHTLNDNEENLDYPTILYVEDLVLYFTLQYLS